MTTPLKTPIVRFAPSPTGYLHIGGARTALFNWLFARRHGGQFRLRIEDTDRARSTEDAVAKIFDGMRWLGLDWDQEVVFQFARAERHAEMAHKLLTQGKAYRCYATAGELNEMRETARAQGRPIGYDGRWRDREPDAAHAHIPPVIRLKAPREGRTVIDDLVQGPVTFENALLDDMVLLRSDGTPTYMLSVVIDDYDMGITHVIRGDDHLNNAARQMQLILALGLDVPQYAHIPMIHGADGAKLSKRHGALGVEAYRDMGYLPETMRNYLVRLGWAHGDEEIFSTEQAVQWFDLSAVGKSPARLDLAKLDHMNGHYIRHVDLDRLCDLVQPFLAGPVPRDQLVQAMPGLRERAKTLIELADGARFLSDARPLTLEPKAAQLLTVDAKARLAELIGLFRSLEDWSAEATEHVVRGFIADKGLKLGDVAQPLRAALTGRTTSPGLFDVLGVLGREESLGRIEDAVQHTGVLI
jgi:glutamyl-tRNA synthetase